MFEFTSFVTVDPAARAAFELAVAESQASVAAHQAFLGSVAPAFADRPVPLMLWRLVDLPVGVAALPGEQGPDGWIRGQGELADVLIPDVSTKIGAVLQHDLDELPPFVDLPLHDFGMPGTLEVSFSDGRNFRAIPSVWLAPANAVFVIWAFRRPFPGVELVAEHVLSHNPRGTVWNEVPRWVLVRELDEAESAVSQAESAQGAPE